MSIGGKREPMFMTVAGRRGVGKTYQTTKMIKEYVATLKRKVLIYDTNFEYSEFKPMSCDAKSIHLFITQPNVEIRRIIPFNKSQAKTLDEQKEDIRLIAKEFRSGLFIAEDLNRVFGDNLDGTIIGSLATLRHRDTDFVAQFQGVGRLGQPKILANTNIIRLHWVEDSVFRHKQKFIDKIEILGIAQSLVNNNVEKGLELQRQYINANSDYKSNKNKLKIFDDIFNKYCRFFCYVSLDKQKIIGVFTEQEFRDAIFRYITENPSETLSIEINKITRDGIKINRNTKEAINKVEDRLFNDYYGNS